MKPPKVLLFVVFCLSLLGLISFFFPKEGIDVFGKHYRFVSLSAIFSTEKPEVLDVSKLLAQREDSLKASLKALENHDSLIDAATSNPLHLQYSDTIPHGLDAFFEALYKLQTKGGRVRILHYGDSQIEEDRITGYVRAKLQAKFGGGGVGLVAVKNITASMGIKQSCSENWQRITAFGKKDSTINGRYGAMAIMCRVKTPSNDSTLTDTTKQRKKIVGTVTFSRNYISAYSNARYNVVKIYMGHHSDTTQVKIEYNAFSEIKSVPPNTSLQIIDFNLSTVPKALKITFSGISFPEIYGISLETPSGIIVDNIPMRGCSGTMFRRLNYNLTNQMYQSLKPNLFILQYGGNTIPYVESKSEAAQYANYLKSNILRIKKMCPNAAFLLIGPADMSTKIDGKMQTYPILTTIRDELKKAIQSLGGAYFDMYEVMGGENSMPSWVEASPALAAKDYIHFSPLGAKKIAKLFYKALMLDYEAFLIRTGKKKEIK